MKFTGATLIALFTALAVHADDASSPPVPMPSDYLPPVIPSHVTLSSGNWTRLEALDKAPGNGWGGAGSEIWNFNFKDNYKKEKFSVKLLKQEGTWDKTKPEADDNVVKKLTCTIEAADGLAAEKYPYFEIKTEEPWITPADDEGAKASCSVDA